MNALLIAWLATIGADRIDLFAAGGPFLLTPFLLLTPLVIATQLATSIGRGESISMPSGAARYALVISAFLAICLLSLFLSVEVETGARRYALLVFQVYGTFAGVIFLWHARDRDRILVGAACAGLAIVLLFNVIQAWLWMRGTTAEAGWEGQIFFLAPWSYGPWIPRLSGPAIDMNRGGFLCLVYLFLLIRFARPSGWRRFFMAVAVVSIIVTLSRSAIMALVVMGLLLLLQRGRALTIPRVALLASTVAVCVLALIMIALPGLLEGIVEVAGPPLLLRVMGDASSSIHFALMGYGVELGSASIKNAVIGVGFGNSFAVLEEFFPGDKYGNFHSLYVTYWVETGIIGLFLGTALLVYPFLKSSAYRPLLGAIIMFNVFYQTSLEPLFWFVIAAAWLALRPAIAGRYGREGNGRAGGRDLEIARTPPLARAAGTMLLLVGLGGCADLLPPSYDYSTIEVEARRLNGEPVEGVDLTLYAWNGDLAYGGTDSNGNHVFPFVPFGEYGVAAGPPSGYRFPGPNAQFAFVDGITASADSDTAVSFLLLKEGVGSVRVQVEAGEGGPSGGVVLELYTFTGTVAAATTDAAGTHIFTEVPAGEYGVRVGAPVGYAADPPFIAGLYVEEDYEQRVSFLLERCEGSAVVSVHDGSGSPVAGLGLTLYTWDAIVSEGVTDDNGTHRFTLECGLEYGVRVDLPPGMGISGDGKNFMDGLTVGAGSTIDVGFVVTVCEGELEVGVIDESGGAVQGAALRLFTHVQNVGQTVTGASGTATFSPLACGQYGVEMIPPAGYQTLSGEASGIKAGLDVTNGTRTIVEFVVDRL